MHARNLLIVPFTLTLTMSLLACSGSNSDDHGDGSHTHADGSPHDNHGDDGHNDMHSEIELEPITIGGMSIQLSQNHGTVGAGEEEHLIIQIDKGDTDVIGVRAWIGSEDRTHSYVGKGEYSVINDAYDIHTFAPEPIDENAMWWIEIEMPDGTKHLGTAKPVM